MNQAEFGTASHIRTNFCTYYVLIKAVQLELHAIMPIECSPSNVTTNPYSAIVGVINFEKQAQIKSSQFLN